MPSPIARRSGVASRELGLVGWSKVTAYASNVSSEARGGQAAAATGRQTLHGR